MFPVLPGIAIRIIVITAYLSWPAPESVNAFLGLVPPVLIGKHIQLLLVLPINAFLASQDRGWMVGICGGGFLLLRSAI